MEYSQYGRGPSSSPPQPTNLAGYIKPESTAMQYVGPRLLIQEQPQERFRFRYESELGGTHGQLAGRSGSDRRSFPTVKLEGMPNAQFPRGQFIVRCELYTEEGSNRVPHVHTLQGRHCHGGFAQITVDHENAFTASFQGLGIIHTAKKQMVEKIIERKLNERRIYEESRSGGRLWQPTDLARQEAREQATSESQRINMNQVCLKFRAIVKDPNTLREQEVCAPIYSEAIYNGKSAQTGELKIVQLSDAHSPCTGNKEIWVLVERVRKNDIRVRVYEEDQHGEVVWQDYGKVSKCHHQYAIIFHTPAYHDRDIRSPVRVFLQLERPTDGCVSDPKSFQYTEREHRATKRFQVQQGQEGAKRMAAGAAVPTVQIPVMLGGLERADYPEFQRYSREQQQLLDRQRQQEEQHRRQLQHQQQLQRQQQHQLLLPQAPAAAVTTAAAINYSYQQPSPNCSQTSAPSPQAPGQYASSHQQFSPPGRQQLSPQPRAQYVSMPQQQFSPQGQQQMSPQSHPQYGQQMSPPYSQPMLIPDRDPTLSVAAATGISVDEVMDSNIPLTVPQTTAAPSSFNTTGGQMTQAFTHGTTQSTMNSGDLNVLSSALIPDLLQQLFSDDFQSDMCDTVPPPPPVDHQREPPPRGFRAVQADSAQQLTTQMDALSVAESQQRTSASDTTRPEVKLAYTSADKLYLFAATGDESLLLENLRCLVGMENLDGDNVLHVAALYCSGKAMASLLEAIAGLPEKSRLAMVNSANASRQTPLHVAVLTGAEECLRLLLDAGAGVLLVDRAGDSALQLAAAAGQLPVLQLVLDQLLRQGELPRLLQQTNYLGFSPLHVAVRAGNLDAVRLLCQAGADISAGDDTEGRSPLHLAVLRENAAMCRLLLDLGSAVDAATFGDVTPLHLACKLGSGRLVALLVSSGADPYRQSVERLPMAGSGTESNDDEPEEEEEPDEDVEAATPRLDAFLYAEMAGDPQLEKILTGRLKLVEEPTPSPAAVASSAPSAPATRSVAPVIPVVTPAAVAVAPAAAVAAGKKADPLDSGLDSGLGITQELSSAADMTSSVMSSATSSLPESAVRRLAALLDTGTAWRTLAELLELDVAAVGEHGGDSGPTRYILHCVQKYDFSLELVAGMLESLGETEAAGIVSEQLTK